MTVDEFYNYITKHMTPEQALRKLLEGTLMSYENLKFKEGEEVHPIMVVAMAALDMGWNLAVKPDEDDNVMGVSVGTQEYLDEIFDTDNMESEKTEDQ